MIILASAIASTAAAAATPEGRIQYYDGPDCVAAGGIEGAVALLPLNVCQNFSPFTSFQGAIQTKCPTGKTATLTAFQSQNCVGATQTAPLPAVQPGEPAGYYGSCTGVITGATGGTVSVTYSSAKFTCV